MDFPLDLEARPAFRRGLTFVGMMLWIWGLGVFCERNTVLGFLVLLVGCCAMTPLWSCCGHVSSWKTPVADPMDGEPPPEKRCEDLFLEIRRQIVGAIYLGLAEFLEPLGFLQTGWKFS